MIPFRTAFFLSISIFVVHSAIAQVPGHNYARQWRAVDSLTRRALPKSALSVVDSISAEAKADRDDVEFTRALIMQLGLFNLPAEKAFPTAVGKLDEGMAWVGRPARAILQNLAATLYWGYLQNNNYKIQSRSTTAPFKNDDIETWTEINFRERISSLFEASLREDSLLINVREKDYSAILYEGNAHALRPTLFDLMAHRALDYYLNGEDDIDIQEDVVQPADTIAFSDARTFAEHRFGDADSGSLHHRAMVLFQRLLRLHRTDDRPDALIDADIERLNWVRSWSDLPDKESRYAAALERLTRQWGEEPAAAEAWYQLASLHSMRASQYHAWRENRYDQWIDTAGRYDYLPAVGICEKVASEKDSSTGKVHCRELLREITKKELSILIENNNLPGQPMRSMIVWRNCRTLYGRIIRVDPMKSGTRIEAYEKSAWRQLIELPATRSFRQDLPFAGDYQAHRTEIKLDALPQGKYLLVGSPDSNFEIRGDTTPMSAVFFNVTRLTCIQNNHDGYVLDAESGKPVAGAAVKMWDDVSDRNTGQTKWTPLVQQYRTDEKGHFRRIGHQDGYQGLEITAGKEHVFFSSGWSGGWSNVDETNLKRDTTGYRHTYLYTDRSIYRPGQTVYFKGIVVAFDPHTLETRTAPKFKTKVFLINGNRTPVDSVELTTNEFGSYHGKFSIPANRLNGVWFIQDESTGSQETIDIEEYKRPRFFVQYDTVKAEYRVGDSIRMRAYARSFAGNMLDGALVRYRVERQVHFAYPCDRCVEMRSIGAAWGGWAPVRPDIGYNPEALTSGVTKIDSAGAFEIHFAAVPDRRIPPEEQPVFEYSVTADITDINGETQSGVGFVRAGYQSLDLSIDQPSGDYLPADKLAAMTVSAENLSGVPKTVPVSVSIYPLRSPDRLIRERFWPAPDLFVLTKEEFIRLFPHDEYGDETRPSRWERGLRVFHTVDTTGKELAVSGPDGRILPAGWYVIEARAKEEDGQVVKATRYLELYDGQTGRPSNPQYVWPFPREGTAKPGDTIRVSIGSSAADVHVIRTVMGEDSLGNLPYDRSRTGGEYAFLELNGEKGTNGYAVDEADRGGFSVADIFVKDNRAFVQQYHLNVPWTNKDLQISYSTFRNKVEPGSREKWAVTIRGDRNDKAAAEVLAGMYDASLDQFSPHQWSVPRIPERPWVWPWQGGSGFGQGAADEWEVREGEGRHYVREYDRLMEPYLGWRVTKTMYTPPKIVADPGAFTSKYLAMPHAIQIPDYEKDADGSRGIMKDSLVVEVAPNPAARNPIMVPVRKNFQETAFFLPDLRTDSLGSVSFSFTMPETLTQWKWMTLAHTRDLAFGYSENRIITQKELMVQPNAPRFLREGDKINLSVKIVNLTDSAMTGKVGLSLSDPTTGEKEDGLFGNPESTKSFQLSARESVVVAYPLNIPYQYNRPVSYRLVAQAGAFSDGEASALPVVSNRMLVTETMPLNMPSDGMKTFRFEKLLHSDSSKTLNHHALTLEFTANPAWYAVEAIPYLMEYPDECAEQTFDRLYANALASKIVSGSPRIAQVFEHWKTADTSALLSNLEKDQELKSVLLEETPWVLEGKTETQQKHQIALLFDMVQMSRHVGSEIDRLSALQTTEGGFPWFKDGPDDLFITQYILTGMARLRREKVLMGLRAEKVRSMVLAGLDYADQRLVKDYKLKYKLSESVIQYLYMRSYYPEVAIGGDAALAIRHYRRLARATWMKEPVHLQGMIALTLFRAGDVVAAQSILASLRETAIHDEELGMYWAEREDGYYWYQAPVETSALMIEAFREIAHDTTADRELKTWLLRQKQTEHWATTKATADAVYALLGGGADWLNQERMVTVQLGAEWMEMAGEAGTGYDKKVFDGPRVSPSMGNITVSMSTARRSTSPATCSGSPAWGAVYWQYFDQLDRITAAGAGGSMPLHVEKRFFIQRNADRGPVLDTVPNKGTLHVGDRVVVRLILRADRDMEYVHLKDMRGACLEPLNVLSGYQEQDGLGYYETTKDVSTEFFFSWVPRGTYVFEYPLVVDQTGEFSVGVASLECMYAPEFTDHTEGIRVVSQ